MQTRLFVLMPVGKQSGNRMSHKIDGTAITRMLILRNIFEIVNIGSFAQHQLIGKGHKMVLHVCAPPLDELKSLFKQQFAQGSGNVAAIPKEPAAQSFDHLGNRSAVIDIAWRQTTGQQFPLLVDDQMQLKAKEPAHAGLVPCGAFLSRG
jgi:hypothetical protein